ncbi:MAG: glycosyltransferase, partial [Nitrosotalea sp.]
LIKKQDLQLDQKNELIKKQDLQLDQKNELIKKQDSTLIEQKQKIEVLQKSYSEVNSDLQKLSLELSIIQNSFTWKFLRHLDHILAKILPPNTKRNYLYRLMLKCLHSIQNKGIRYTTKAVFRFVLSKNLITIAGTATQIPPQLSRDLQYHLWQLGNKLDPLKILSIKEQIDKFTFKPKISIVMPVFNTDPKWLQAAIESVLNQLYQNWELCIVDDCSTKPGTKETLSKYTFDKRIKIKYLQKNLGISGASNESLSMNTGDFVGFLDHDDEIYPYALFEVVKKLNEDPNLDILYSDEDKTNSEGDRFDPFFKPDWSPALLLSTNYMAHFLVCKKNLLQNNLLRSKFDGAQDYDLILRLTEKTDKIGHISKPLYSWRQITGSTSTGVNAKSYASKAAQGALEQALLRRKLKGEIREGQVSGSYRVKYDLIKEPKVSIIIPTRDKLSLLKKCIDSLEKTNYKNYEVIIVDNNSKEKDALNYLNSVKHKVIKFDEKFNFSKINNFAAKQASGEYLLFLNNDTEIFEPDWLREMVTQLIDDNVGVVGPMLLYGNGTIQHGGVMVGFEGKAGNCFIGLYPHQAGYFGLHNMVRNCASVTAACMLVKRKIFDEVGGFDEKIPIAYGDVDLCLKILTADYDIVYTPYAKLFHHESVSRGTLSPTEDAVFFNKKWNTLLKKGDPYYNPNLSLLYIYQIKVNETYVPGTLIVPQPKPISLYDRMLANDMMETKSLLLNQQIDKFTFKPKISIVMPVFNTDPKWLQAAIESVLNQLYQNWELCIVDDCSTKPETKETLSKYTFDKRIKIKYLQKNLGISGASNESLSMCAGDFIGFLDHDDEIYPYALFEVVKKLNEDPNLDILYSDEDKLEDEKRVEPYFKPDWSPDLILSSHYMAHFLIYRKKLIDKVGGFRSEFDGSQDYDLVLRATEKTNRIGHIPKVLYGWRKIPSSTSQSLNAKSYAIKRTTKLIDDALKRRNIDGHAEYDEITTYHRVVYTITDNPLISIIIPTKDNLGKLKKCLDSISKSTYKNYEIIIISNGENEETWKFLHTTGHKIIEYKEKFNVSKVFNLAASFTKGSHLLFMNDDMQVVNPEWLNVMLEHSQRKEVGIVGCLLIYPPDEMGNEEIIQHAGVILGSRGVADHAFKHKKLSDHNYFNLHRVIRNCSVVTGACMMVKKRIFEELGGWDERLAISYNDIDFCLRVSSKGYSIIYTPFSKLYHFEAATRGTLHPKEDEDYFIQKWEKLLLQGDRYYNCNLSLLGDPYSPSLYPHSNPALSSLLEVYYNRIDLQNVYPEAASGNCENLVKWALSSGLNETFSKYLLRPYLSFYSKYSSMK